jgi:hypothetical protein
MTTRNRWPWLLLCLAVMSGCPDWKILSGKFFPESVFTYTNPCNPAQSGLGAFEDPGLYDGNGGITGAYTWALTTGSPIANGAGCSALFAAGNVPITVAGLPDANGTLGVPTILTDANGNRVKEVVYTALTMVLAGQIGTDGQAHDGLCYGKLVGATVATDVAGFGCTGVLFPAYLFTTATHEQVIPQEFSCTEYLSNIVVNTNGPVLDTFTAAPGPSAPIILFLDIIANPIYQQWTGSLTITYTTGDCDVTYPVHVQTEADMQNLVAFR